MIFVMVQKNLFQSTFEWLFSLKHCRIQEKNHCPLTQTFLFHYVRLKKLLKIGNERILVGRFLQASPSQLYSKIVPPQISFQVFLPEVQNQLFLVATSEKVLCAMLGASSQRLNRFYFYTYSLQWLQWFLTVIVVSSTLIIKIDFKQTVKISDHYKETSNLKQVN